MLTMRMIARAATAEHEIKKSRFIATVSRVGSEEEARGVIEATRKAHWSANHTCSAWSLGADGSLQRTNDDGEPGGSAGAPMLTVLTHWEVTNVVATVTRYFGGTKLGVGGLIRAYGGSVAACLEKAGLVAPVSLRVLRTEVPHAAAGKFEHALRTSTFAMDEVTYNAAHAAFDVALQESEVGRYLAFVAAVTSDNSTVQDIGERTVEVAVDPSQSPAHR
jgi:uncharacterized YigZ family protein